MINRVITPDISDEKLAGQMAEILVEAFRENWPEAWPDFQSALEEVLEFTDPKRICRAALDGYGNVAGWIGGICMYDGNVWELHPLAVIPSLQKQGVGRLLVQDFELQVQEKGALTILLGTDDENSMTSLAGVNLYTNLWDSIRNIQNLKGHPYEFYRKLGFEIVGVVPDANGRGKPDILMAKSVPQQ
jgi:aminoglycoside 6'-N-acetyltransferase I